MALLTNGVDVDTIIAGTKEEKTSLLLAAENGHKVLVEILLHHGADIYVRDQNGGSILSLSKSHSSLHEWLQDKCEELLITASKDGDVELVKKSLEIGVNPNAREKDKYGWTALLWACENGHTDVVDCLLAHDNVDVNVCDSQNWTGLILSSRRGNLSIVKKLLDKSAGVNILTKVLWSALHWTAQEGHTEVARLLLERGAIANTQDEAGFTPLLQASQDGHLDIVKVLVEHAVNSGIDLDQHTMSDWTAIMAATKNGHEDIVQYLVDHGFDPHYQKEDGVTALHIASYKGHNKIIRYLCLTKRLVVDAKDVDGITPLMFAAKQGHFESVRTLFENGHADPNIQENDNGWTALFFAVEARHNEVLDYLLKSGRADVTQRDHNGTSIMDVANAINFATFQQISKHYQIKMEAKERGAPVDMKRYIPMLTGIAKKINATPDLRTSVPVGAG